MRRFSRAMTILGGSCLVAMLALSSPGVRVVRAADDVATEAGDGAVCEAGTVDVAKDVAARIEKIQRHSAPVAAQGVEPQPGGGTIALNNRGYNYGEARIVFPPDREIKEP